jgi:site-specific DNA recombinase
MTSRHASIRKSGTRAAIYCRISDDREGTRISVERQEKLCRDLAEKRGLAVVDVYVDDDISASSATKKRRPDYQRLLTDARTGRFDVIVSYTLKRLTRRYREGADLIDLADQCGIRYSFVRAPETDLNTAAGRKQFRNMVNDAISESEEIGERVRDTFDDKRAKGEFLGGRRLFGWADDGQTPVPREHGALAEASQDVTLGVSTYEIKNSWNADRLLTSRGNRWTVVTVRQVLLRPRNAGLIVHDGEIVGHYPWADRAPVPEDVWQAVCAIFEDPDRRTTQRTKPQWLGSGLYVCWGCEMPDMRVGGQPAAQRRMYRCERKFEVREGRCHVARQTVALDAYVEELIVARLSRPDAADLAHEDSGPSVDVKALRVERATVRLDLDRLDDDLDAHRIDRARWTRRNSRLQGRLDEIELALKPASMSNPFVGVADADDPAAVWYGARSDRSDGLALPHRRRIMAELLKVRVLPVRAKGNPFDPGCIDVERLR